MKNVDRASLPRYAVASVLVLLWATSAQGQTLTSVYPPSQRVHEYIELQGSGFGTSQSNSLVRFTTGLDTWDGGRAYVWRDNFIRIRVPVGKLVGAAIVPISKDSLDVFVQVGAMASNPRAFRVVSAGTGTLEFRQLTAIAADHGDTSIVLGSPNMNSARTKDAEIADVNGDGWPDLSDNNSNNVQNNSHTVLRLNNQDKSFTAIAFEPLDAADSGTFPVEVSSGGDFFLDHTSYDADYADINNDRLPDLIQTAADNFSLTPGAHRVRILMNN